MKIALLHYAAPPVVGGVENVIGHHARLMADAGHEVRILAGRGEQFDSRIPFVNLSLIDSRHAEILTVKSQLDAGKIPAEFASLVEKIEVQLAEVITDTDWVIVHNVCSLNKNLALTAALKNISDTKPRPALILWHHDLAWTTPRYRSELHDGYPWDLLRIDWPKVKQVVVSEARRQELASLMGIPLERIRVISNGIDVPLFLKLEEQTQEFIQKLNLLSATPLMLLPVRITPRKNIELALNVLSALREHYPQAKLVVTGPLGPHNLANVEYFDRLRSIRKDLGLEHAAHFLAEMTDQFLPDVVISDFYRLADLLFYPSREEGFGLPILEAGLTGIPIFCTDIPALRDLGNQQVYYFSTEADPAQLADQIAEKLESDLQFKLRARVRHDFTWQQVYTRLIAPLLEAR